ncbi:MAG: ABC transporter permease [Lachnospiraceae bacterium]|nr:ABC transporter permease [Lachnospiraceae bacterium]
MTRLGEYFATHWMDYIWNILRHLEISAISVAFAMIIAIPLGILSTRCHIVEKISVKFWGMLRIIPSVAILIVCIPIIGTGIVPAVVALTILAIPPILINTTQAFKQLPESIVEAAVGMGMNPREVFFQIKVPLAFPIVFTGIRTAIVEVVASATLAAYIGAGGLGEIILTGLGLMRNDLLWLGGITVAVVSLGTGYLLNCIYKQATKYQRV